KICQQKLVNEVLGPHVAQFALNLGHEGAPSRSHLDYQIHQTYCLPTSSEPPPPRSVACCAHQVQSFDLSQTFWCRAVGAMALKSKFLTEMNKTQDVGKATQKSSALTRCRAERAELDVSLRSANLPRPSTVGAFLSPTWPGPLAFFGQPPKCEVAHTSFRLAPLKSGRHLSGARRGHMAPKPEPARLACLRDGSCGSGDHPSDHDAQFGCAELVTD